MILTQKEYIQKVLGCWNGKNVGGNLGAPFECARNIFEVEYYTQKLDGEPLPNDDLDLQLVWLNAAEDYGRFVNSKVLGEYWNWYITPHWGEYGAGKNNMRAGIMPPLSGKVNNVYGNSCGAFILSEIWACLTPGHPELAVNYAYEDATVNHFGEGLYAEVFCAAIQSAAFAESDTQNLIEIGLSYIPQDCDVAKGIRCVQEAYEDELTWQEARKKLLIAVPGSFGALGTPREKMDPEIPVGKIGWDAPSNIGIIIIGLLYGEGNFGKSICIAAGCGEDADCTAGTLGSLLGIIGTTKCINEKWLKPLGGKIKTKCINNADVGLRLPQTVEEMTERVVALLPEFAGSSICQCVGVSNGYVVQMDDRDKLCCKETRINSWYSKSFLDTLKQSPYVDSYNFVLFDVLVDYGEEPFIKAGKVKTFHITVINRFQMQQWLKLKWYTTDEVNILPAKQIEASLESYYCNLGKAEFNFEITLDSLTKSKYEFLLDISAVGHHTRGIVPIVLFASM